MRQFYIGSCDFEKLEYQNREDKKEPCFIDFASEGVLLDNFIIHGKRGLLLFKEHYLNSNSSDYLVTFVPYKNDDEMIAIWWLFDQLCENEEE